MHLGTASGTPLAGQLVTLQLGSQQGLGSTDANGQAVITLPLNPPPGPYAVVATFAGAASQGTSYTASSSVAGTFTVTPGPTALVLTPASVRYGDSLLLAATLTDSTGTGLVQRTVLFTVTGNGSTTTKTAITDNLGRAALDLPAATYTVTATFGGADHPVTITAGSSTVTEADPEYLTAMASGTLTVTPAPLTITASSATSTYGGTVPAISPTYSGLVNGDTALAMQPACTTAATSSSPVGNYPTTCKGAADPNYAISYVAGTLTVAPVPLTITANNGTMLLHGAVPVLTASYRGFVNGDTSAAVSGLSCSTTATSSSPVGSYPITCKGAVTANYSIGYTPGTLAVRYAPAGLSCGRDAGHAILRPVNPDGSRVFKAGRTVPTKFRVCDANGVSIGTAGVVQSFQLVRTSTNPNAVINEAVDSTTPDSAFRWDAKGQQWIFNISTRGGTPGIKYFYEITLNDGTTIDFSFALR